MMRINNDYWRAILSVTKVSGDTGATQNRSDSLQNLVPGEQVKGEVLARLSDQVHLVKIEGNIYRTEFARTDPARNHSQPDVPLRRTTSGVCPATGQKRSISGQVKSSHVMAEQRSQRNAGSTFCPDCHIL